MSNLNMDLATIVWLPCTVIVLGLLTEFCATFRSLFQSYRELQEERVRHQNTTRELSRSYMEKGALKSNLWKKEDELKSTAAQVVQLRETLQKEVAELKQERQTHTQEITELKQGRQNLNLEIAGLKRERISHTREIGELKLERQNHLQEIAEHKRKHLIHQQTISGLEENLSKHTDLSKMMNLELCELSLKISREVTARQKSPCAVCLENETNAVFVPCGHMICLECSHHLDKCHTCRVHITTVVKVFS